MGNGTDAAYDYQDRDEPTDDDLGNNLESILWNMNDGVPTTLKYDYTYDKVGNRLTMEVNDIDSRVVKYEYDKRSLRTKLTYPDSNYISYEYDAMSRLRYIKDDSNNVIAEYEYDALGRRTLLSLANDANAVYEYDIGNRLTKLTNNIDDTNTITFEYADYDKVGNRESMKIDDANAHVYTYDVLYQLTNVDYNDGNSTDYYYDDVGNRTKTDDGSVTTYLHNILNQYYSVGGTGYSYDDNGNLTDDGTYEYYYDCENHLTDVNENGAVVATYEYDYAGRRIKKTVYGSPDVVTKYVYDGDQVIAEYEDDTLVRKFVYGPGIDEPICMIVVDGANETRYYYHYDGLGSVIALTDDDGDIDIVEQYSYDAFGTPDNTSSIGNPYMFTSRRLDNETGLYYYRARYYDPETGRFLQTDPLGYVDSMNLYEYCENNPINWLDPYGLFRFGIKNIDGSIIPFSRYLFNGLIPNALNIGSYHQTGFYEDRTGDYADYGTNGLQYPDNYDFSPWQYDDNLMRQAQKNVDASGNFTPEKYRLFRNNCQSYCSALEKEYKRLGGKVKFRPFRNPENMKKKSKKGS